jgi:hypothetical protein
MATAWLAVLSLAALSFAASLPRTGDVSGIMRLPVYAIKHTRPSTKRQIDIGLNNPQYGTEYIVNSTFYTTALLGKV